MGEVGAEHISVCFSVCSWINRLHETVKCGSNVPRVNTVRLPQSSINWVFQGKSSVPRRASSILFQTFFVEVMICWLVTVSSWCTYVGAWVLFDLVDNFATQLKRTVGAQGDQVSQCVVFDVLYCWFCRIVAVVVEFNKWCFWFSEAITAQKYSLLSTWRLDWKLATFTSWTF